MLYARRAGVVFEERTKSPLIDLSFPTSMDYAEQGRCRGSYAGRVSGS
jgi:hypothetical protein